VLSILIPTYNERVVKLVQMLSKQKNKLNTPVEILVFEDNSSERYRLENEKVNTYLGVNYIYFSEKMGRAGLLKRLLATARYDYVLILDAGLMPSGAKFLKNYMESLESALVLVGGWELKRKKPTSAQKMLDYKLATKMVKNQKSHDHRTAWSFLSFSNAVFPKSLLQDFDHFSGWNEHKNLENEWLRQSIPPHQVLLVNSLMLYPPLTDSQNLIENQKQFLTELALNMDSFPKNRMVTFYHRLQKLKLVGITTKILNTNLTSIYNKLTSANPSLASWHKWRFAYFLNAVKKT